MSNVNNQFKELINEAIHNHFHDKTETEMILKDWLYGICEQLDEYEAKAIILDRVKAFATDPPFLLANNEHEDYELYAYDQILRLIEKYESGNTMLKNDEVDYCTKCTVKPIVKEHMCEECYTEHCQWLSELSAPKQDDDQWYTLYESKA